MRGLYSLLLVPALLAACATPKAYVQSNSEPVLEERVAIEPVCQAPDLSRWSYDKALAYRLYNSTPSEPLDLQRYQEGVVRQLTGCPSDRAEQIRRGIRDPKSDFALCDVLVDITVRRIIEEEGANLDLVDIDGDGFVGPSDDLDKDGHITECDFKLAGRKRPKP